MTEKAKEVQKVPASAFGSTDAPASEAADENVLWASRRSCAFEFPHSPPGPASDVYVRDLETGNHGVQPVHPSQRGVVWGTRALAIALLVVGAIQWAYASDLRSKEIEINEYIISETTWGRVGQPWIGKLAVMLGALMLLWTTSSTAMEMTAPLLWIPPAIMLVVGVIMAVHEQAVYQRLNEFVVCTEAPTSGGACVCFEEPIDYEGASSGSTRWTWNAVDVSKSSNVACEDIPGLSDDVLTSLALIWTIQGLMALATIAGCLCCAVRICRGQARR